METPLYNSMNYVTKTRFLQRRYRYGKEIQYKPHTTLVINLAQKLGWGKEQVIRQLYAERNYLMRNI